MILIAVPIVLQHPNCINITHIGNGKFDTKCNLGMLYSKMVIPVMTTDISYLLYDLIKTQPVFEL